MDNFFFDIDSLHQTQYDILVEFDRVCKKYNLTYFLAFGTLLGAERHNGFIPWDDDVDTLMPYSDFKRLQEIPKEEWKEPYFLQTKDSDRNYPACFYKLRNSNTTLITENLAHLDMNHGVDIDIYPLIKLSDNIEQRRKQYLYTKLYMLLITDDAPRNHGIIYYMVGKIGLFLIPNSKKEKIRKKLLEKITAYDLLDTKECYVVNGNLEVMGQNLLTKWFEKAVPHLFVDKMYPIPIGTKEWLTKRYGEHYMQLPPEEKRGCKINSFIHVDLEKSFASYKGTYYCVKNQKRTKVKNDRWVSKDR